MTVSKGKLPAKSGTNQDLHEETKEVRSEIAGNERARGRSKTPVIGGAAAKI